MNINVTKELIDNEEYTVVDIRTQGEWEEGIVKGSHLISFWDEMGQYDAEGFVSKMKALEEKEGKEIALICRTGNRTGQVAGFLNQQGLNVKSLNGGVMSLGQQGYSFEAYQE